MTSDERDTKTVTALHRNPEEPVVATPMRDMMTADMASGSTTEGPLDPVLSDGAPPKE